MSDEILGTIAFGKVLTELPAQLSPSTVYLVLNNNKVYIWVSDHTGTTAYPLKTLGDDQTDVIFAAMMASAQGS